MRDDGGHGAVFAVAFAISAIFESADAAMVVAPTPHSLTFLAATLAGLVMLGRPSSLPRLVLLALGMMASLVARLPLIPNHGVFEIALTILVLASAAIAWRRSSRATTADVLAMLAPALRWSLVALYFWAVVQKLNVDFFDPAVSCGPLQVDKVRKYLWWLVPDTSATQAFGIYGTLVVEALIPVLLVTRARLLGVALALGFHWVLGAAYARFSAMLIVPLVAFLDPDIVRAAREVWRPIAARAWHPVARALVVAAWLAFAALVATHAGSRVPRVALDVLTIGFLVYGGLAMVVFGAVVWAYGRLVSETGPALRSTPRALLLVPALLFANGLAPHVGLKNTQVFAMYSNLRTEGGRTNHLFLPASMQVVPVLRDLVMIVESTDPVLAQLARRQWHPHMYFYGYIVGGARRSADDAPTWRLPWIALRRRVTELALAGDRNVRLVYERDGHRYETARAERDPRLTGASWLERKLLLLRAVPAPERGYCMW